MSDGLYLFRWRVVLGRASVCRRHHTQAVKRCRNTPRQASHVKHLAVENKCGVGKRGQTPKSSTGLQNEVQTPHQLRYVSHIFRGSYIHIHIYNYTHMNYNYIYIYIHKYILHIMYICIYTHYIFIFISIVFLESQSLGRETTVWKGHGVIDGKCPTSRST